MTGRCADVSARAAARTLSRSASGRKAGTLGEGGLEHYLKVGLGFGGEVAGHALDVQVDRSGRAGGGLAEGLPQQVGELLGVVHHRAELGDRGEGLGVLDFLVGVLVLLVAALVAGQGDDRRQAQVGVLQPGGQVGGAHRLRHADARLAGGPGVAVGHVGRSLFAVGDDPLDADEVHLGQRPPQDGRHEEDVGNPVGLESVCHELSTSHTRHRSFLILTSPSGRESYYMDRDRNVRGTNTCPTGSTISLNVSRVVAPTRYWSSGPIMTGQ